MDDLNPITRTERLLDGEDLTPTNREEMFIKRIYDKTQEIPEPVNRKEYFLKKAGEASGDVTVVPLSVTDNGTYSEEGKAYSPVTVSVQPPANSYQLKSITTPTSLATFEASAMPMPSLKVSVEAKQASGTPSPSNPLPISGWDAIVVSVVGKNLLPLTLDNLKAINTTGTWSGNVYTQNGVSYTVNTNNGLVTSITTSNTATSNSTMRLQECIPSEYYPSTVIINGCPANGGTNSYRIILQKMEPFTNVASDSGNGVTVDTTELTANHQLIIRIANGYNADNLTFYPMVRIDEDATFEPYNGTTTTISLPQTVYGGEVDVVNGTSGNKVTHQLETISGGITRTDSSGYLFVVKDLDVPDITDYETVTPYIISNYLTPYSVNDLRANAVFGFTQYNKRLYIRLGADITTVADANAFLASNPLQIKYELATPTTFTTQPTPIKSLNGQNNLSVDCGEILEGEYFKALGGE